MSEISDEYIIKELSPFVNVASRHPPHKKLKLTKPKKQFVGDYELDRVIGRGKCGFVHLAWHPHLACPVAIKLISRKSIDVNFVSRLVRELDVLGRMDHPHVVRINEIILDNSHCGLVMDWASNGDIFKHLCDHGPLDEPKAQQWFAQLVWTVDDMHSVSLVHRDIKPENILIDDNDNIVLTDFEMCESFRRRGFPFVDRPCGSQTYCPPEAMSAANWYDACKADVWAMGVTLYTMMAGFLPFDDRDYRGTTPADIAALYRHIAETPLEMPDTFSAELNSLLHGLLDKDPNRRLSLADVKKHPWLRSYTYLWDCPGLLDEGSTKSHSLQFSSRVSSRLSSRFGSLASTSSLQTLSDKLSDCKKQVRGPIIWDPMAGDDISRTHPLHDYNDK